MAFLPVVAPSIGALEERYVMEAVRSGWVSSIGAFVDRFEHDLSEWVGTRNAVAISNGTDALFLALASLGVGPGDEVVVPDLTFAAVAAVVVHLGAEPVFADVHPDYWCLDPDAVSAALSDRTKAIIAVHSYGHPADMSALEALAARASVALVEDCAEAHGALCNGRPVGSLGRVGTFSFYGNKLITSGEGGCVTTNDDELADRVRYLKDHAMSARRRYYHTEAGYNCRMTNLQAALGCAQLERASELLAQRRRTLDLYLRHWGDDDRLVFNPSESWANPVVWLVSAVLRPDLAAARDRILLELRSKGIDTRPFFVQLSALPPYRGFRAVDAQAGSGMQHTARLSASGFNLPSSGALTDAEVGRVATALRDAMDASV